MSKRLPYIELNFMVGRQNDNFIIEIHDIVKPNALYIFKIYTHTRENYLDHSIFRAWEHSFHPLKS